jgi:protein TonB|tara:strand:- start:243 stop:875 length:633 start_codon:yes stop_codon:yes gene_type:complete
MTKRFSFSVFFGLLVSLLLFYMMQALIAAGEMFITEDKITFLVDIVRVKDEPEMRTKRRKAEKPPPPDEPPPAIRPVMDIALVAGPPIELSEPVPPVEPDVRTNTIPDGEYLPIVKVQPAYPRRALARGLAGWVIVEFTVSEQGSVVAPAVVANCAWAKNSGECHDSANIVFDNAAVKAALRFKYKPRVLNGVPIATSGVRNRITFELVE